MATTNQFFFSPPLDQMFASIIGHKTQLFHLSRMLRKNSVPHALLFSGSRGIGKWTVARCLANALLEPRLAPGSEQISKTEINTARLIETATHPDFHLLSLEEAKKEITVEAIRTLCHDLRLTPYYARSSVAIIDEAHRMSAAASNALLMTLEEPGVNDYLFLISDKAHQLPLTILSRCQTLHFGDLSSEDIGRIIRRLFSGIIDLRKSLQKLIDFTGGSLAALELESFFDARTHTVANQKALVEHLTTITEQVAALQGELIELLDAGGEVAVAKALSLASEIAGDDERWPLLWRTLRYLLRGHLRGEEPAQISRFANLLLECVSTEQEVSEHNANAQLSLTTLLLHSVAE